MARTSATRRAPDGDGSPVTPIARLDRAGRARSRNRGIQQTLAAQFARIAQMQPQVDLLTKDRRR